MEQQPQKLDYRSPARDDRTTDPAAAADRAILIGFGAGIAISALCYLFWPRTSDLLFKIPLIIAGAKVAIFLTCGRFKNTHAFGDGMLASIVVGMFIFFIDICFLRR